MLPFLLWEFCRTLSPDLELLSPRVPQVFDLFEEQNRTVGFSRGALTYFTDRERLGMATEEAFDLNLWLLIATSGSKKVHFAFIRP